MTLVWSLSPADLYEIPITLAVHPSRKPMARVAPKPRARKVSCPICGPSNTPLRTELTFHIFPEGSFKMLDFIFIAGVIGIFVLSIGYAYACDRL